MCRPPRRVTMSEHPSEEPPDASNPSCLRRRPARRPGRVRRRSRVCCAEPSHRRKRCGRVGLPRRLAASHASWFYTWSTSPGELHARHTAFVPMVWGAGSVTSASLAAARRESRTLLTFNEPDRGDQANMTPAQALAMWPRLQRTGMTLASPAVSAGADQPGGWLDRFMRGARARHYRVGFIAVHWYGSDFRTHHAVDELKHYLMAVHARYRKAVWLTEYSLIRFGTKSTYPNGASQAAFVRASIRMLDSLPWVQRYAWFALSTFDGGGTGLYRPGAHPTVAGKAFAATR